MSGISFVAFYVGAGAAVLATALAIMQRQPIHALLYLTVSLLGVALTFLALGAPLAAALEVIIYAGAVMVLFVFATMTVSMPSDAPPGHVPPRGLRAVAGPAALGLLLAAALLAVLRQAGEAPLGKTMVAPRDVSLLLYGTYGVGVELASMLLLAGLIGAYHLARRSRTERERA